MPPREYAEPLYETFGPRALPGPRERGYVADPFADAPYDVRAAIGRAVELWHDPEAGPQLQEMLASEGYLEESGGYPGDPIEDEDRLISFDELPDFLGVVGPPEEAAMLAARVVDGLSSIPPAEERFVPFFVEVGIVSDALVPEIASRPRLVLVSKDFAEGFIRETHSALPEMNPRGLLYVLGIAVGGHVAAVGVATTPSGAFKRGGRCDPEGIVELSRIASDGTVRGASSMLASRLLDLLPQSGRKGTEGCLFVTYSLRSEAGTTYLALADKGLRPVALRRGKVPTGARREAGTEALSHIDKIVWEAGPAARPPEWSVLLGEGSATPEGQVSGAKKQFEAWEARQAKMKKRPISCLSGFLPLATPTYYR